MMEKGDDGFQMVRSAVVVLALAFTLVFVSMVFGFGVGNTGVARTDYHVVTYQKSDTKLTVAHVMWDKEHISDLDRNVTALMTALNSAGWQASGDSVIEKGFILPTGCLIRVIASEKEVETHSPYVFLGCSDIMPIAEVSLPKRATECLHRFSDEQHCGAVPKKST